MTLWNAIFVAAFLGVLVLPVADWRYGLDTSPPIVENRQPAPLPAWPVDASTLRAYPAAFEGHWGDTFGFRRTFVRAYGRILVAFHTSPLPNRVTVGSGGWLFYASDGSLADYKGELPFRESDLVRWQYLLENRRDWLKDRGIPFVFFIAPSKETIYPDKMPWRLRRGASHRLDQFLDFMATHSDLEVIDPRALLTSFRSEGETYTRTDSHWSALGAWLVKERVIDRVAELFPAVRHDVKTGLVTSTGIGVGDLVGMIGLSGLLSESMVYGAPKSPRAVQAAPNTETSSWTTIDDARLPRAVFFHDSFGNLQRSFFAEHFSWLRTVWMEEIDPAIVETGHPQLVFQEMTQRFLQRRLPNDSMELSDNSRIRSAFDSSIDLLVRVPGDAAAITLSPPLSVETLPSGTLVLHSGAPRSSLQLPELRVASGSFPVVRVALESPTDARLELFYQTTTEPSYHELRRVWWPLHRGENLAWLIVPDPDLTGRLRLDLTAPGDYRLTSLQVRAVPRTPRPR